MTGRCGYSNTAFPSYRRCWARMMNSQLATGPGRLRSVIFRSWWEPDVNDLPEGWSVSLSREGQHGALLVSSIV